MKSPPPPMDDSIFEIDDIIAEIEENATLNQSSFAVPPEKAVTRQLDDEPTSNKRVRLRGDLLTKAYPLASDPKIWLNCIKYLAKVHTIGKSKRVLSDTALDTIIRTVGMLSNEKALDEYAQRHYQEWGWPLRSLEPLLRFMEDAENFYGARRLHRSIKGATPIHSLAQAFIQINPVRLKLPEIQFRLADAATRLSGFEAPALRGIIETRRTTSRQPYEERVYNGTLKGVARGARSARVYPLPLLKTGKSMIYVHFLMAQQGKWNLLSNPMMQFHLQAWALRLYANKLEELEFEACPFTRRNVEWFRRDNDDENDIRYLIEAYRVFYNLFHKRKGALSAQGYVLPYYEPHPTDGNLLFVKLAHLYHPTLTGGVADGSRRTKVDDLGFILQRELDEVRTDGLDFRQLHRRLGFDTDPIDITTWRKRHSWTTSPEE